MVKKTGVLISSMIVALLCLVGCGGGGGDGGVSTGGVILSHSELADEFTNRLNIDLGFDVVLEKSNTLSHNYIVIYDYDYNTYDAYDLTGYSPGQDLGNFLDANQDYFFYDLDVVGENTYEDPFTGSLFSKTTMSSHDMTKATALVQQLKVNNAKEVLSLEFGLPPARSAEIAKSVVLMQKNKNSMTKADLDDFVVNVSGSDVGKWTTALTDAAAGNPESLESAYADAAAANDVSPEHMKKVMQLLLK